MTDKSIRINIPYKLSEKLKSRMSKTNYHSMEDYIIYILNQLISSESSNENNAYGLEEEENVKEMLKDLGYL
jgi:hypothetical protein